MRTRSWLPFVSERDIVGFIRLARGDGEPPFDQDSLATAAALCAHVSVVFALQESRRGASPVDDVGKALGISENTVKTALKNVFRKLEIRSRAALVARLRPAL